jgi:acetyl-CoA carboxylase alpha subunit
MKSRQKRAEKFHDQNIRLLREACDEFVELRRSGLSGDGFVTACARIKSHSFFVLIHSWHQSGSIRNWFSPGGCSRSRQFENIARLTAKFNEPLVVCIVAPSTALSVSTKRKKVWPLPEHLLSQWSNSAPILLIVLASNVPSDVFALWLAHRSMAFEHTKFIFQSGKGRHHHHSGITAKHLVRLGILQNTISQAVNRASAGRKSAQRRLRNALSRSLHELAECNVEELKAERTRRLLRTEALLPGLVNEDRGYEVLTPAV